MGPSTAPTLSPHPETQEELHLSAYWGVIVKHRRLVAWSVAIALVVGIAVSILSKPTYRASAVLSVEREKSGPFDITGQSPGMGYDPEFVPTQTRLMKSREVATRAVSRLRLTENTDILPAAPRLGATAVSAEKRLEAAALNVQTRIATVPIRGTNLVELSFVAPNAKLAADIANAVAEAYIDWNLESKYLVVGQASRFLGAQIEQLKLEVAEREKQLQAYARREDIVSVDPQQNSTLQSLETLNKDYANAVADRVAKEARYFEMQNARPDAIADPLSNGLIAQLRNEQAKMEREYAEKLNLFKPDWPAMQQLRAQIEKGRQHLQAVVQETVAKARDVARNDYQTALRREQSLRGVLQGQKNEAMNLNANAVEYNNLRTDVETKRTLLDTLLKRQAETEVTSRLQGQRVSNIRIVDRALPPQFRFRPSYRRNALLSLIFGLGLGVGLAFLFEYLDRSLRTVEQVEKYTMLPALGVIPAVATAGANLYSYGYGRSRKSKASRLRPAGSVPQIELLPQSHPRSTVAEAYRAFRTALLLSRAGGLRSIVVTSSLPGEGKTSTCVNLAVVLAQLGKRVLLVDGDLHKPRVHEVFKISNRAGLVSVLVENTDPALVMVQTSVKNLFVIPAGPISPNPSGLLSSPAMDAFLSNAKENFDYIIIDAPPVGAVADPILLGYIADGVVLCVRGGRTPREQVTRARDRLTRSNVRILGVLINNLEERTPADSYYYGSGAKGYAEELPGTAAAG
jgi:capsular exopolysaccharide synthesis family protein